MKKLTDREHILLRPAMYIGSVDMTKSEEYIFEDNKIQHKEIEYVPGLIKIINEIIDNCVDVAIKTNFKSSNQISVKIEDKYVEIKDNGTGIPVKQVIWNEIHLDNGSILSVDSEWKNKNVQYTEKNGEILEDGVSIGKGFFRTAKHWQPELAWGHARAGSNFEDDANRTQIGMNGVGSFATNCFSNKFVGLTDDGQKSYKVTFKENASQIKDALSKTNGTTGTTVKFWPDFERFGLDQFDDIHKNIIYQRLINLGMSFPEIQFKFNSRVIKINSFKKYIKLFSDDFEMYETENYKFAIVHNPSDDFRQFSYVNGLKIPDGGTHIDTISNQIVSRIRDKLSRKYKTIKPGDIKNKLMLIVFMKNLKNPKFNSQSKEKITNSGYEISSFFGDIPYDQICAKILKNKNIIDPITEVYRIKEEFKRRQELKGLKKSAKKIRSEKYYPATERKKYLMLVEGDSAFGGLSPILGRKECGYYALKGKPLNAFSAPQKKFTNNAELSELFKIIENEDYQYIIFGTDQDLDGFHIRGLLMGFFHRYLPHWKERIGILNTPVIMVSKKNKIVSWHYSLNDDIVLKSGEVSNYYKGLGTWDIDDLKYIISQEGLNNMIDMIDFDDDKVLDEWLGNDSELRKKYILQNDFSIAKL